MLFVTILLYLKDVSNFQSVVPSTLAVRSLKSNPEIKSIFRRSKSGVQNGTSQGILLRPLQPDLPVQGGQVIPSPSGMVTNAMFCFFFISKKLRGLLFRAEYKPRGYYLEHFWQADLGYIWQAIIGVKVPNSNHVACIQHGRVHHISSFNSQDPPQLCVITKRMLPN